MTALELFTLWVAVAASVTFGAVLVLHTGALAAGLWAAASATAAAAVWGLVRCWVPTKPPAPDADEEEDEDAEEGESDATGGWDVASFLVAVVVVPLFLLVATLLTHWLAVVIVVGMALATDDPSWGSVWGAAIAAITVSLVAELAVSRPLQRRWGHDLD